MTDNYCRYSFSYSGSGEDLDFTFNETDDNLITWPLLLSKFIKFLEMTHNYEIMHKVQLKYSPFIDSETDWQGKFFDVPEDKEEQEPFDEYDQKENAGLTE